MSSAHPGFKAVQSKIAKSGVGKAAAGAILANATRHASAAAKRANPRLNRVKGKAHGGMIVPHDVQVSGRSQAAAHSTEENPNQKHGITGEHKHHLLENVGSRSVKKSDVAERHVSGGVL
jgi:hypothetical protein